MDGWMDDAMEMSEWDVWCGGGGMVWFGERWAMVLSL